jgi:hypothetical protein
MWVQKPLSTSYNRNYVLSVGNGASSDRSVSIVDDSTYPHKDRDSTDPHTGISW